MSREEGARVSEGSRQPTGSRRSIVVSLIAAVIITAGAFAVGPRPLAIPEETSGDAELARQVRDALRPRPGVRAAAIAVVRDGSVVLAGIGTVSPGGQTIDPRASSFEIGSLTKPLTGMLLESMTPHVVEADSDLGTVLGPERLEGSDLGEVTLAQLAHHQSGLPRLPLSPALLAGSFATQLGSHDPYPDWPATRLIAEAADTGLGEPEFLYSNLGAAVLGHTLALAADQQYPDLLREQILESLGMEHTTVVVSHDGLPSDRVVGSDGYGRAQSPWVSPGFAPAGVGTWSTAADLGTLLDAILEGSAPGLAATRPDTEIASEGAYGIGYFWLGSDADGETITWHDGGTGGFRSWMGFNRDAGTGVAILTAGQSADLHELGIYLLGGGEPPDGQGWSLPEWYGIGVVIFLAFTAWRVVRAANRARQGRGTDLVGVIALGAEAVGILTLGWVLGPWTALPWAIWSVLAAATLTAVVGLIWWNRDSEWFAGGMWHAVNMAVSVILAVVFFVLVF
jgi:CubicO group peptidase (beta-lactamase class C family)